jgi:preprotein translocase subunit SecA
LREGFSDHISEHMIRLTYAGEERVNNLAKDLGPLWMGKVRRIEMVGRPFQHSFFKIDKQYILRDGKVQIIDEFTGRVMSDNHMKRACTSLRGKGGV